MINNADYINDIQQLLPTVFIEQVVLQPYSMSEEQKISTLSATMSLKDVVEKDGISQWFAEEDLKKFMRLNVFIIKSETLYNSIINFTSDNPNYSFFELQSIALQNKKDIATYEYTLPTKEELEQNKGVFYSENYIVDNDDGTQEITIPIKTEFRFIFEDEKDPFISLIAFMTFDLKEFASTLNALATKPEFDMADFSETRALSKSLTPFIAIKNGAVVSQFQYFLLPNNQFYYGQYHIITLDDGTKQYRTGAVENQNSENLQLVTDIQNIVLDMRARRIAEPKPVINETEIVNNLVKSTSQIEKIIKDKNQKPSNYFSEPLFSLDENGNCRFSFFFNKEKFIKENCFYPPILNQEIISQLVRIKSIGVYRIRKDIKEINFNSENNAVLVAWNKDASTSYDLLAEPDLNLYEGSYVTENNVEGINPSVIKSYSVYDSKINNINYGLYKYKIALDIVDPTKTYLLLILNSLTSQDNGALPILEKYYNLSISNKRQVTESNFGGDVKLSKLKLTPYFDNLLGKFISSFSSDNYTAIVSAQFALQLFLNYAKQFGYYTFTSPAQETEFNANINKMLVPPTASPDTILIIVNIVKEFIKKLESILGIADAQKKSSPSNKNNIISFEHTLESESAKKLENYLIDYDLNSSYENYFNASISSNIGFKILNKFDNTNSGLNSISLLNYKNLTDLASQKHFDSFTSFNIKEVYGDSVSDIYDFVDEFNDDDSKYCFLPISSVSVLDKKYNFAKLTEQLLDQKFFQNLFFDILNYNTLKQVNFSSQQIPKNSSVDNQNLVFKSQSINLFGSVVSIDEKTPVSAFEKGQSANDGIFNIFGKSGLVNLQNIDDQITKIKNDSVSSDSNQDEDASSLLIALLIQDIMQSVDKLNFASNLSIFSPLDEKDETNPNFFLNKFLNQNAQAQDIDEQLRQYIRDLPIPIKHLIVSRGNLSKISKVFNDLNSEKDATKYPENFFKFWITFKNIYEIQYFDGFASNNINSPIWKKLTINKIENSSSKIFCRIQKYKLPQFEKYFPEIKKLDMPIFDKYFYIIPDNNVDLFVSIENNVVKTPAVQLTPFAVKIISTDKSGPISYLPDLDNVVNVRNAGKESSVSLLINNLISGVNISDAFGKTSEKPVSRKITVDAPANVDLSLAVGNNDRIVKPEQVERTVEIKVEKFASITRPDVKEANAISFNNINTKRFKFSNR